jgi:hypothetical protein
VTRTPFALSVETLSGALGTPESGTRKNKQETDPMIGNCHVAGFNLSCKLASLIFSEDMGDDEKKLL